MEVKNLQINFDGNLHRIYNLRVADLQKWTSDSEMYNAGANDWPGKKTGRRCSCPVGIIFWINTRRSSSCGGAGRKWNCPAASRVVRSFTALPSYSQHEMEDWIVEHDPSPSESEETGGEVATALLLPAISENIKTSRTTKIFSLRPFTRWTDKRQRKLRKVERLKKIRMRI